jgi:hypothetical protein
MIMVALTWVALIFPTAAEAVGQLVTIVDDRGFHARVEDTGAMRVAEDQELSGITRSESFLLTQGELSDSAEIPTSSRPYKFIIDTISVQASLPSGQRALIVRFTPGAGSFHIPLSYAGTLHERDYYQATVRVKLYAVFGVPAHAYVLRNSASGTAIVSFSISAHYVLGEG